MSESIILPEDGDVRLKCKHFLTWNGKKYVIKISNQLYLDKYK